MTLLRLLTWPPPLPVGNPRFGLAFISAADHLADETRYQGALAAGARWNRWPLYWHWVDAGGYVGTHEGGAHDYDTLVPQDLAYGLTPLVILLGTPTRYVQPSPPTPLPKGEGGKHTFPPTGLYEPIFSDGSDAPGPGKTINPANVWAGFVYASVNRYRPGGLLARLHRWPEGSGVRYWEVWNEPDYASFWGGTVEEYYRLLEVAYKSIKTADPQATVVLGGLAFYEQRVWFPAFLRQTGGRPERAYFDVFSFHHYLSIYRSEELIRQARTALSEYGLADVPIWITESGASVWDDYPATAHHVASDTPLRASMVEQAAYVIQNSALAFYSGAERYFHFQLHDDCGDGPSSAYGLRQNFSGGTCNPAEGKPRPAYAAYQLAAAHFREVRPLWREQPYGQEQLAFYRPADQSRLVVLWATQGVTTTAAISATGPSAQLLWVEPTSTISGLTGLSRTLTLTPTDGLYTLTLPPATNQNSLQPDDASYQIGGLPFILVERDTQPPRTSLQPLPTSSPPTFLVHWRSDERGSGIAAYDVYVSQDNGPLQLWLARTIQTEAKFSGQLDHTYGFAVRARDGAGNEEPMPTEPHVTTLIAAGPTLAGTVLGPGGELVANATVNLTSLNAQQTVTTNAAGSWPPLPLSPGEYELHTSAPGYGTWPASRRVSLTETTRLTLTLAPPTNALASGDFEGNEVWNVWEWQGQVNLSIDAFDGQAAARLGDGRGDPAPCPFTQQLGQLWTLQQPVAIPSDPNAQLSFLYKIFNLQSPISTPTDQLPITNNQSPGLEVSLLSNNQRTYLFTPGELNPAREWQLAVRNLSAWQGQSATLQFRLLRCTEQPFSVSLDRVSVGTKSVP
ncbi:MAG: carboxypeptidase regulatory-like domain-containing protein [Anaerolineae bacterium]